ncbi:hypothetical protein B6S44_00385 [Bosea sp. Tri-44]|uniref:hypothetical protein n=1 Tax=Bosea sp. Tri-44 TaxID=1972137 RepID=UPI00100FEA0A|nr:hypothetical protein [Bosea sp. Tri-44]RXT56946.1 hypothetical protein B6S44_00385 [Bosea sp. Tri-44]
MSKTITEFELICSKADAAWTAIQSQYVDRLTTAEIDFLFSHLVLGLTSPFYAERDPALHFTACSAVIGRKLPPERVHAALHAVPEPSQPWVERAFGLAEEHGTKIAMTLAEQRDRTNHPETTDHTDAKADAAHRELSSGAKEQVG